MKKIIVTALTVVICFATALAFTACDDTSALEERIAELESKLEQNVGGDKGDTGEKGEKGDKGDTGAVGPQGPKGDSGISETLIIHKLGDTVIVYEQGAPMFSIKYASKTATQAIFEVFNANMSLTIINDILLVKLIDSTNTVASGTITFQSTDRFILNSTTPIQIAAGLAALGACDRAYFISKGSNLIFAVFEI